MMNGCNKNNRIESFSVRLKIFKRRLKKRNIGLLVISDGVLNADSRRIDPENMISCCT